jgi:hypothetical protein
MTFTHRIFVRSGQCLAATALMTGIAVAAGPTANAGVKELQDCMSRGGKTFASCCIDSGGAYTSTPVPGGSVNVCVISSSVSNEPPVTVTKPALPVPKVAPPPLENSNQPNPGVSATAVPVKPRA